MARLNISASGPAVLTHEGAQAIRITPLLELRRSVLTALLWEDTFYEKGSGVAARIQALVPIVKAADVAALAIEARERMYLRHVPLFIVRELARVKGNGPLIAETLARVIQRPDELTEYLAMYWQGQADADKEPLSAGSKRGLARAFRKFKAETLAKYDRDNVIKLRDVLRITHAKPSDAEQGATWKHVVKRTLDAPDTWEVALSAGANKKETFERLLREQKLGGLAFLRNLRNMIESSVDMGLMRERFAGKFTRVLPFRFLSAAAHAPRFESDIERAMLRAVADLPKLTGTTVLVVDVSGSMTRPLSAKSELNRLGAAAALAILVREQCEQPVMFVTAGSDAARIHKTAEVPARHGMAVRDLILNAARTMGGGGIFLVQAMQAVREMLGRDVERVIVLTDEQDCDLKLRPEDVAVFGRYNYLINISNERNGIGYGKKWTAHIDGWSERVLDFIAAAESEPMN